MARSLLHTVLPLVLLLATSAFAVQDINNYQCPEGYVPYQLYFVGGNSYPGQFGTTCVPDPCYKDACGAGNSCKVVYVPPKVGPSPSSSPPSAVIRQCTCQAPAVSNNNGAFCNVPGSNPCSSNPCHNGGECFNGLNPGNPGEQGSYFCRCPTPTVGGIGQINGATCDVRIPSPAPTLKPQGVCGSGDAGSFPIRCWFTNDPQGRYVCCDNDGCNGFAAPDYIFPRCQTNGFAPPGYGVATPPPPVTPPPVPQDQGVCGTGDAGGFPVRCWFNNDPQGRYVCCDGEGCDGFNSPDNFFPHCKKNAFVPAGMV